MKFSMTGQDKGWPF